METERRPCEQKQTFNKKKWRETQYSHKHKVAEWDIKRKQAVQRKYRKFLKKDCDAIQYKVPIREGEVDSDDEHSGDYRPKQRLSDFEKAKQKYEKVKQEKEQRRIERIQKEKEREEVLRKKKIERLERMKKLTKKTKKGQPVMKGRIEILLEKIQKDVEK